MFTVKIETVTDSGILSLISASSFLCFKISALNVSASAGSSPSSKLLTYLSGLS